MVALLKEDSFVRQNKPLPCLAPRLRLVPSDDAPLWLDLEHTAEVLDFLGPNANERSAPVQAVVPKRVHARPLVTPQLAVLTAVVVLALLTFVRMSQGAPPASNWDSLAPAPAVATAPGAGETVRIVDVGDTMWAIAEEISPNSDRRVVVDALAQRNGGSGLQVGQRLVIPLNLIAG